MRFDLRRSLLRWGSRALARPALQSVNRFLFDLALRGLGILNYESAERSGEAHLLGLIVRSRDPRLPGPAIVLDVGANVGSYAELVLDHLPDAVVHAFEPHPQAVSELTARIGGRVTIVPNAVGASAGVLELFDYGDRGGSSHASLYREVFTEIHRSRSRAVEVPVTTLDAYIEQHGISHATLLKVDTEGHELEVLRGARSAIERGVFDCIQFEFNEMNIFPRAFLRDFRLLLPSFSFYRLLPRGAVKLVGAPLEEIFAYQNIVAARLGSPVDAALSRPAT